MRGLFLNSPAVIIGAMGISPILEPIYAGTVFIANGNMKKLLQHIKVLGILLIVLIIVSAIVTACLTLGTTLPVTPEIITRAGSERNLGASGGPPWYHRNSCPHERLCHRGYRCLDIGCSCATGSRNRNNHSSAA